MPEQQSLGALPAKTYKQLPDRQSSLPQHEKHDAQQPVLSEPDTPKLMQTTHKHLTDYNIDLDKWTEEMAGMQRVDTGTETHQTAETSA